MCLLSTNVVVVVVAVVTGKLTEGDDTVFSLRLNPAGTRLVYMQCEAGGPHHSCSALKMVRPLTYSLTPALLPGKSAPDMLQLAFFTDIN